MNSLTDILDDVCKIFPELSETILYDEYEIIDSLRIVYDNLITNFIGLYKIDYNTIKCGVLISLLRMNSIDIAPLYKKIEKAFKIRCGELIDIVNKMFFLRIYPLRKLKYNPDKYDVISFAKKTKFDQYFNNYSFGSIFNVTFNKLSKVRGISKRLLFVIDRTIEEVLSLMIFNDNIKYKCYYIDSSMFDLSEMPAYHRTNKTIKEIITSNDRKYQNNNEENNDDLPGTDESSMDFIYLNLDKLDSFNEEFFTSLLFAVTDELENKELETCIVIFSSNVKNMAACNLFVPLGRHPIYIFTKKNVIGRLINRHIMAPTISRSFKLPQKVFNKLVKYVTNGSDKKLTCYETLIVALYMIAISETINQI